MKTFFVRLFTWWNSQTFGTQWSTWLYGEFVGDDEFGNRYYRTKGGKIDATLGFERRWVIYRGVAEASMVPPTEDNVKPHEWEKPHRPNLTGTPGAYRPSGSILAEGRRPKATGDYKAWSPGN
jgi:NADH:ubiquinone oxidoreductase subunit